MIEKLFPKLGIAAEASPKIKESALEDVASGKVDIAIRPISELLNVPGVDFVGPIPKEIQFMALVSYLFQTRG